MKIRLADARDAWNREVEGEAVRLIERGTPPDRAVEDACKIVSQRRQHAAAEREDGERP